MTEVAGFSVLALTVSLSLARPKLGPIRIHPASAAVIGALLMLSLHVLSLEAAADALALLVEPMLTIISLMMITCMADEAGLFAVLARAIARRARGSGPRLFAYLFFTGTLVGSVFTNDAAVLIFTPLVFGLVEEVAGESWTLREKLPFYFSVLYVANVVGALAISNPINIIVAGLFDIGFLEYAKWMLLPALISVLVSFAGIRIFFARAIPRTYRVPEGPAPACDRRLLAASTAVLAAVLAAFFAESFTGVPVWLVAVIGAMAMLAVRAFFGPVELGRIARGVGWDVIVFVAGIFLVARGLKEVGFTHDVSTVIDAIAGTELHARSFVIGFASAFFSAIMNNHPTADTMAWVIRDLGAGEAETKVLALSALIGGDLGPKMLPIGSLAALLWFGILRRRKVEVPYGLYIRVGVPVTLAAILLSLVALNLQLLLL